MTHFALRNMLVRRRRVALTVLSVVLGVSMIAGTLIFTDTIHTAFGRLFTGANSGASVIVSSRQGSSLAASAPASIPDSLVGRIAHLPGVSAAQGQIVDSATVIGSDGKPLRPLGAPTVALSYVPPPFDGLSIESGTKPTRNTQVVVDSRTAANQHWRVGDVVSVVTNGPVRRFEISGIASFTGSGAGGEAFVVFDPGTARELYDKQGQVDRIYVAAARGTSPTALVGEIDPLIPPTLVARTTRAEVAADVVRADDRLGLLTGGLLAFGVIALLVGAFTIFNTYAITVARRMREFALLRAVGATRAQVLGAVVVEAGAVGLIASAIGVAGGLLVAVAIRAVFIGVGYDLPSGGLTLTTRTVLVGCAAGLVVTLLAGLVPAVRATRPAPLEALRASALTGHLGRWSRWLLPTVAVLLAAGGVLLAFLTHGTTRTKVTASAGGGVMLVLAVVAIVPAAIPPLTRTLSWPLVRRQRVIPMLARENTLRNPLRTAVAATSLLIGLALVLFVTVYANGLKKSTATIIDRTVLGDFTIQNADGVSPIPSASARAAAAAPGVLAISSLQTASAQIGTSGTVNAKGVDPTTISQVYRFDWMSGSAASVTDLQPGQVFVERDTARAAHLHVGDSTTIATENGTRAPVVVRGIYVDRVVLPGFVLPQTAFNRLFHTQQLQDVFVRLAPGASPAVAQASLDAALRSFPGVVARSESQLRTKLSSRVDRVLLVFYALLALSVLMALLGIINTLTLSVQERTGELGLLRAVGMTGGQARAMVRTEGIVTAAIGTVIGIAVGVLIAWVISHALTRQGLSFSIPWLRLVLLLGVGLVAGVLAGLLPAARAARIDVLAAIADE